MACARITRHKSTVAYGSRKKDPAADGGTRPSSATFWYFKRSCGSLEGSLGFHLGCHLRFHLGFYLGLHLGVLFRVSFRVSLGFRLGFHLGFL